eukprot:CAMPEP_0181504254 /NCGR_PEP_ID=MMETSP1110-20121109/57402_1 /TAXON_ID=174948 /ORGANISM="Symbiodinium sp., Strain CCMP421" /LENGTH=51 /DNA_ID=CAMNT_0023633111 /DNA_START=1060 /DNA_END=1212 /DNA_ORIENTATION=-
MTHTLFRVDNRRSKYVVPSLSAGMVSVSERSASKLAGVGFPTTAGEPMSLM